MCVCFVLFILLSTLDSLGSGNGDLRGLSQVTTIFLESSKEIFFWLSPPINFINGGASITESDFQSLSDMFNQATIIYGSGFVTFSNPVQAYGYKKMAQARANSLYMSSATPSDNFPVSNPANIERLNKLDAQLIPLIGQRADPSFYSSFLSFEWIAGFAEAEGGTYGAEGGQASFSITQHISDWYLLEAIRDYLGAGYVRPVFWDDGRICAVLSITNKEELRNVVIPLLEGRIRSLKKLAQFNEWRETHFNLPPVVINPTVSPAWLAGFVDGDGSFYALIHKASDYRSGFQVQAVFDIAQLDTERALLENISQTFFGSSHTWAKSGLTQHLRILKFLALQNFVLPFFQINNLLTRKSIDFVIWQEIIQVIADKEHLTSDGVNLIRSLRSRQHINRNFIDPTITAKVLVIKPNWVNRLNTLLANSKGTNS